MEEIRTLNISFNKAGNGYINGRLAIPTKWLKDMGIDSENKAVKVSYKEGKIEIEKLKS